MQPISASKQHRITLSLVGIIATYLAMGATVTHADFPRNKLYRQDNINALTGITQAQFDQTIEEVGFFYRPLVAFHGGELVFDHLWSSSEVNAYAFRSGDEWHVEMHGGLARRAEVTLDGFKLVICHELGHHLGGYPFKGNSWAASEGESDWYATQACARWIWRLETTVNATFRTTAPVSVRDACDAEWSTTAEQDLCYRISMAGKSLADLLAAMEGTTVDFTTPDNSTVATTNVSHPPAQCRLDTYVAGGLCTVYPELDLVPGENSAMGRNSIQAELEAAVYSCMPTSPLVGAIDYNGRNRPRCWFKNQLSAPF